MSTRSLASCLLALLFLPAVAPGHTDEGRARFIPWSGYWWKIREAGMLRPLRKYDALTGRSATPYEARAKDRNTAAAWAGYCHAWSAASIMEPEPRRSRTVRGANGRVMTLGVGDQKAWLTVCHDGDDANAFGTRYNGPGDDMQDIYPDALWKYLRLHLKQRGVPLCLDIEAKAAVWNYPAYRYRVVTRPHGQADMRLARMEVWMADDKVNPDFIGTRVKKKTYQFTYRTRGGAIVMGSGRWYGTSRTDHPDFAWYPTTVQPKNPHVSHTTVRRMLGVDSRLVANRSLATVEEDSSAIDDGSRVAVSSTELAVLLAGSSTAFPVELSVELPKAPAVAPGDPLAFRGKSAKDGHLYLLHTTPTGQVRLLYPMAGQENKVRADRPFRIGSLLDNKQGTFDVPPEVGKHQVKALVTDRPLDLGSLVEIEEAPDSKPPLSRAFEWSPSEEETVRDLLGQVAANRLTLEALAETTGTDTAELLGTFGRAAVTFQVAPRPR